MPTDRLRAFAVAAALAIVVLGIPRPAAAANDKYLCLLADTAVMLQEPDLTVAACTALIQADHLSDDDRGLAYDHRSMMFNIKGDHRAALQDSDHAVGLRPKDPVVLVNRGVAWLSLGETDKAAADFTGATRLAPHFAYAWYARGEIYAAQERWEEALADYRTAVHEDPQLIKAATAACGAMAIRNQDLESALLMCDRSIRFTRGNPIPYLRRSLVRLRQARPADALRDAEAALAISPDDPEALHVKGLCELRLGRADAAQADIKAAGAKEPDVAARYARWGFPAS